MFVSPFTESSVCRERRPPQGDLVSPGDDAPGAKKTPSLSRGRLPTAVVDEGYLRDRQGFLEHPRSRGDDVAQLAAIDQAAGLIPARVGTTPSSSGSSGWPTSGDYPRSRGDDSAVGAAREDLVGLSPLARGRPVSGRRDDRPVWTIPARAGTTATWPRARRCPVDYPRSRGDDFSIRWSARTVSGHPRSRGDDTPEQRGQAVQIGLSPLARGRQ